jgi:hypothetical protein
MGVTAVRLDRVVTVGRVLLRAINRTELTVERAASVQSEEQAALRQRERRAVVAMAVPADRADLVVLLREAAPQVRSEPAEPVAPEVLVAPRLAVASPAVAESMVRTVE